jgi:YlmC/YmxH family sporulation protein
MYQRKKYGVKFMGQIRSICTLSELKRLEVINICDGSRMGNIVDVEMDLCNGNIIAILLPKKLEILDWFRKDIKKRCRIPWCQIDCIGYDTILVRGDEVKE